LFTTLKGRNGEVDAVAVRPEQWIRWLAAIQARNRFSPIAGVQVNRLNRDFSTFAVVFPLTPSQVITFSSD